MIDFAGRSRARWQTLRDWARRMKCDVVALWLAARDPRTPVGAKITAAAVAAYALSPIDLIPDVVPVLGYLDDVIIVPLGILIAVRLIPLALMAEFRAAAAQRLDRPASRAGLAFVLAVWLAGAALLLWWLKPEFAFQSTPAAPDHRSLAQPSLALSPSGPSSKVDGTKQVRCGEARGC